MVKSQLSLIKHKALSLCLSALIGLGTFAPLSRAEAGVDPWAAAAQALGVYAAYKSTLSSILAIGNDPVAQVSCRRQDIRANGRDRNNHDRAVVDEVMEQLVSKGEYALRVNSLPFIWEVNNSNEFNAACYPTNYISVNRALVRGLQGDPDELAAVLAHEMIHGLRQHSAHNYAKAAAQYYGMAFLNIDMGLMDWNKLTGLADYSIAKNVTLPSEYEADEGGFYLMSSAGFNPGGGAAAMYRMGHYLTYETRNVMEYQDPDPKLLEQENFNDHPDTGLREKKLADLMTAYGAGHVTVWGRQDVCIDGERLLTVDWTGDEFDNTAENAYYTAGALAKAFHDYDTIEEWQFRSDSHGNITCLEETRVNRVLQEFLRKTGTGGLLQKMVAKAYRLEKATGARVKMKLAEARRSQDLQQEKAEAVSAKPKEVKKLRENGDVYSDLGMGKEALFQLNRSLSATNQENPAENYTMRGRAKAILGDYEGALADADKGVDLDDKNVYNFLNRADVHRMRGEREAALADCERAKAVDGKNAVTYLLMAQIYEEMADREKALENYKELHRRKPKAFRRIPEEYLQEISPKDYKTLQKEKEEAKKAKAEAEAEDKK